MRRSMSSYGSFSSFSPFSHPLFFSRFWLCILSVLTILDLSHHFILVTFRGVRWVILNRKLNTCPKFKVSSSKSRY